MKLTDYEYACQSRKHFAKYMIAATVRDILGGMFIILAVQAVVYLTHIGVIYFNAL